MRYLSLLIVFSCLFMAQSAFGARAIDVERAHAKASFPMAQTGAVYFTVTNSSQAQLTLVGVSVDESVAADAQLHTTVLKNDMMRMREVTEGLMIPAGDTATLKPGGYHVMLLGLEKPLVEGETFPLTLSFAEGDSVTIEVAVTPMDTGKAQHKHHQHNMH